MQLCTGALGRKKKAEDWQQMLAQGQFSSPKIILKKIKKKKRILDLSSGLVDSHIINDEKHRRRNNS